MAKKQTDEEEAQEAVYTHFEANSVTGLMSTVTSLNRKIKQFQEEKIAALDVLSRKFKNTPKENLLAVRDNEKLDADVRWAAGFILSIEYGVRHNP